MPSLSSTGAMLATVRVVDPATWRGAYALVRVDTGDDITIVSPSVLASAGAVPTSHSSVEGIDGTAIRVPTYHVLLDLGQGQLLGPLEVLGLDMSPLGVDGLLGDNALDEGVLVRDGPTRTWSFAPVVSSPPPPNYTWAILLALLGAGIVAGSFLAAHRVQSQSRPPSLSSSP